MIALAIRFVAGRYHATPWGANVNEAAVEWPPSPWRLARALISSWRRTAPHLPETQVEELLEALALPPEYHLPPASPAHSRHFMPLADHRVPKTMVFDGFLRLNPDRPLGVAWDRELSPLLRQTLDTLVPGITYLGRSESWCDVLVVETSPDGLRAAPLGEEGVAAESEVVRLLAPARPVSLAALQVTTAELQGRRQRRKDPPGANWVQYVRPEGWSEPVPRPQRRARPPAYAVAWALEGRPLPLLTDVEDVVRAARRAVRLRETEDTGRFHLLAWCADEGVRPRRLDRLALWAEQGLTERELERACRLGPFEVSTLGVQLTPLLLGFGELGRLGRSLVGPGRIWRSLTPMLPWAQFRLHEDAGADQAASETLFRAALPAGEAVVELEAGPGDPVRWLEFRRGWAVGGEVRFAAPVTGPLVADHQPPGFGLLVCVG